MRLTSWLSPLAAVALSSSLLWFGTGMHPIWYLTWVAVLPILLVAPRTSARAAAAIAFAAWFIGSLNTWSYLTRTLEMPLLIAVIGLVLPTLLFIASVLIWRALVRRRAFWRAALAFPAFCVTCEWLISRFSPHSTWGSIAYSQMDCLPIIQIASITGFVGITFLLYLVPAALATKKWTVAAIALAAVAAVAIWGTVRLFTATGGERILIGLASIDRRTPDLIARYAVQAHQFAAQGANVIVLPEKILKITDTDLPQIDESLRSTGTSLVAGFERWTPSAKYNEARVYSPGARLEALYEKHHMLPAFESHLLPGTARTLLHRPSGTWGVTICKDMDFPRLSREYSHDNAGLLLVPAWDFVVDGWLHSRMAILRGVESGFSIARSAKNGLLTASDDRGRVLAQLDTGSAAVAAVLAALPVRHTPTLYARFGDWFAFLNIAVLLGILLSQFTAAAGSRRKFSIFSRSLSVP